MRSLVVSQVTGPVAPTGYYSDEEEMVGKQKYVDPVGQ